MDTKQAVRPVFVTGTMRSGTSMVCHLLTLSGIDFLGSGPRLPFDDNNERQHNPNGYYERQDVHDAYCLLYYACNHDKSRSTPMDLVHDIKIPIHASPASSSRPPSAGSDPTRCAASSGPPCSDPTQRAAVSEFLCSMGKIKADMEKQDRPWGLKCIQMAQNLRLLQRLAPNAVILYCFRSPNAVHQSMLHKSASKHRVPERYWKNHNLTFLRECHASSLPVRLVHYDDFIEHPGTCYRALLAWLRSCDIVCPTPLEDRLVHEQVHPDWRHFSPTNTVSWTHATRTIWTFLLERYKSNVCIGSVPTNVLNFLITEGSTQKPNDKCSCGSGLKYKKCCIN